MESRAPDQRRRRVMSRRALLGVGIGAVGAGGGALLLGRRADRLRLPMLDQGQSDRHVQFLSTQLTPDDEVAAMRTTILADFPGTVDFVPMDEDPFMERVVAEGRAGSGTAGLLGGQHGQFATLQEQGLLEDLRDLAEQLRDRQFVPDFLVLARFRGEALAYLPWMQASYIMVARRDALAYLPDGLDEAGLQTSLTYDQLGAWATRVAAAAGPKLGLPGGATGLLHRFLQGYTYPSYTRGVNTTFRDETAVAMWRWLAQLWPAVNPASTTYEFMQAPLLSGDVWIAWDHTARLIDALRQSPGDFVAFPAPRGPMGLGYTPVVAGLAIPRSAPDKEASRALIEYLTRPRVQAITAQAVSFFPAIEADLPEALPTGAKEEADAIDATLRNRSAIPSLLPVGLGAQNMAYNAVFRDAFQRIVIEGEDVAAVLAAKARDLQAILDVAQAPCWPPDPRTNAVCQVG